MNTIETIDWKALTPHIPLSPGASEYVARNGSTGDEIAKWILADRSPLLIGGPAGVGKSTELARAAELLQPHRVACLIQLDRFENMRTLTPERMLQRLAWQFNLFAEDLLTNHQLNERPDDLLKTIDSVKASLLGELSMDSGEPEFCLLSLIRQFKRLLNANRVTLLIDGLEKVPPGREGLELFAALASIADTIELVITVPWHLAFGPLSETVIRARERFIPIRAVEVKGEAEAPGRELFHQMLSHRLGNYGAITKFWIGDSLVDDAITWSGGVPRTFLQLMAGAGFYVKKRTGASWPRSEDLADAVADQQDSFRRLLLPGDAKAIIANEGTDGRELEFARKVRLLAHVFLLERLRDGRPVLQIHPLARRCVEKANGHA